MLRSLSFGTLFLLTACSQPTVLEGKVTDVWGNPISGASIQLAGVVDQTTSANDGTFSFELDSPPDAYRVQAGKEAYIPGVTEVEKDAEGKPGKAVLELYPEPKQPGFYAVGEKSYQHLGAEEIKTLGSDVEAYTGLPDEGDEKVYSRNNMEFVFQSTLKASELSRLNLQLHELSYVEATEVPGVLGDAEVRVNLWTAKEKVEFDLQGLPRDNTYLITTRGELKGVYAFSTQGVLNSSDATALDKLPKEMRVAYPFTANQK